MTLPIVLGLGLLSLLALSYLVSYNRFVSQKNLIAEAWKQIDVELQRRFDLIPNLVETVKAYAKHEQETLTRVIEARNAAQSHASDSPSLRQPFEAALGKSIGGLLALGEAYPDLKANTNYAQLQAELTNTEDRIAAGRRFYNGNVRAYNTRRESVPSNIIAAIHGFAAADYFELDDPAARKTVKVQF
jgi:LemA protein